MRRKVALFLYPLDVYVRAHVLVARAIDLRGELAVFAKYASELERIMTARFRMRGYEVVWVVFARQDGSTTPDRALISPVFPVMDLDTIVTVPISFGTHCEKLIYPNPEYIIRKLGRPKISSLAVCGFHDGDCVEKFAQYAHSRGIHTKVHDDLTEHFFSLAQQGSLGSFPVQVFPPPRFMADRVYQRWRAIRRAKPWRRQWKY